ncbi:AAA domain-containing protein/AAA_assoc domain-containing protein [Cephalotus follicularis]|uniref:AAA domain-containing protein/AAA_assoc domain-containing protein n=1 Tax=Cephalotus follicularis TaxID=3775 RepID=A0A1Q3BW82_CEPFO|nr:AAA domain-containing protein/AAA_assoc domain-containing protein [Cephalotus follicularis]
MKILSNPFFLFLIMITVLFLLRILLFKTGLIYTAKKLWRSIEDCFHVYQFFKVPEFNENMQENNLYYKVSLYITSLTSIEDSDYTNLFTGKKQNDIVLRLDHNQTIDDDFLGARVSWINQNQEKGSKNFVLKIRRADKRRILRPYLQHIHTVSDEVEQRNYRDLKLHMNIEDDSNHEKKCWRSIPFNHPSTFDTISMEPDLKNKVKSDLESFLKAKQYYQRLGRAWKRSFLLYGPSGTGKSSFVAAMANFLHYDIYDIDLSKVKANSDLKSLLLQTTSKALVLIEDLDRYLMDKSTAVSLSSLFNFMDGIWSSCCAEERIMVFTMNNKDLVEPAVLRPGRIDVHLHFPLCDFSSFKSLASSYLRVKDHKLFSQVEEIFQTGASLSPAEIGELMIANRNSPSRALKSVITALQTDGDGRGTLNIGQLSVKGLAEPVGGVLSGEGVYSVKDFKKLYGLWRMKNNKKSTPFDSTLVRKHG